VDLQAPPSAKGTGELATLRAGVDGPYRGPQDRRRLLGREQVGKFVGPNGGGRTNSPRVGFRFVVEDLDRGVEVREQAIEVSVHLEAPGLETPPEPHYARFSTTPWRYFGDRPSRSPNLRYFRRKSASPAGFEPEFWSSSFVVFGA
jgi:hypothetical protein